MSYDNWKTGGDNPGITDAQAETEAREAAEEAAADRGLECAYCGGPAQGNYSVHRDGFCLGPEVPLCDLCGGTAYPSLAEIWDRIAQPCPHGMTVRDRECDACDEAEAQAKRDEDGPPDADHELGDTARERDERAWDEKRSLR